jgi:hypothetical protein
MATKVWLGAAVGIPTKQVLTIGGTWVSSDTVTITINNKSLTLTVGSTRTSVPNILSDIVAMIQGDSVNGDEARSATGREVGEFTSFTAVSNASTIVTIYGPKDGRSFTASVAKSSTSGTASFGSVTMGTGPNYFDNTANWSGGSLPVDSDDILFDHRAAAGMYYALAQTAITPASITFDIGFAQKIGLPDVNRVNQAAPFDEYLGRYLQLGTSGDALNIQIRVKCPSCSRLRLDTGSSQATLVVSDTGARELSDFPVFDWKGTHASNEMTVAKGDVGVAFAEGDTSTLATLRMNFVNDRVNDARVTCGDGATLTTVTKAGGQLTSNSNVTTFTQSGGDTNFMSGRGTAATLGTATVRGGVLYYQSTGAIGTKIIVAGPGKVDFRKDNRARTIAAVHLYQGAEWQDPEATVTATNGYNLVMCSPADIVFNPGANKNYADDGVLVIGI